MKSKTKNMRIEKIRKISLLPKVEIIGLENFFKPEEMPLVDASPIGRHRLLQALRNKFGASFRNIRGVSSILNEYDIQAKAIKDLYKTLE